MLGNLKHVPAILPSRYRSRSRIAEICNNEILEHLKVHRGRLDPRSRRTARAHIVHCPIPIFYNQDRILQNPLNV